MTTSNSGSRRAAQRQWKPRRRQTKGSIWQVSWIVLVVIMLLGGSMLAACSRRQDPIRTPAPYQPGTASAEASTAIPAETAAQSPTVASQTSASTTGSGSALADAGAPPEPAVPAEVYTVRQGDTLSSIAQRFGCDMKTLVKDNQIENPRLIRVGQEIRLSSCQLTTGLANHLLPNSEYVNGPAYVGFDTAAFSRAQGGYLATYREKVGGTVLSGPEIVDRVAYHYSVGPRLLLALLELKSGWVTDPNPTGNALSFPMGYKGGGWELLSLQVAWAADELNKGYYDWRGRGMAPITWPNGEVTRFDPSLNAATAGLQRFLSLQHSKKRWKTLIGDGPDSFLATYRRLFGNPNQYAIEPLIPAGTTQPKMSLPWSEGELWYYTGGPHGAWEDGSAWAAVDFVPDEGYLGCRVASSWATAAAAGLVIYSQEGEVVIDLDEDGHGETGWVLFYLHVAGQDRVEVGTRVKEGDRIGHPSCVGGLSEATHLHFARRYNGEWIAADGPIPLVLSGWQAGSSGKPYEGTFTRGKQVRTACECSEDDYNGIVRDR